MNPCACGCGRQVATNKKGKRYFNGACRAEHSRHVQREKLKAEIRREVLLELAESMPGPEDKPIRKTVPDRRHRTYYDDETYRRLTFLAECKRLSRRAVVEGLIYNEIARLEQLHGGRYAEGEHGNGFLMKEERRAAG